MWHPVETLKVEHRRLLWNLSWWKFKGLWRTERESKLRREHFPSVLLPSIHIILSVFASAFIKSPRPTFPPFIMSSHPFLKLLLDSATLQLINQRACPKWAPILTSSLYLLSLNSLLLSNFSCISPLYGIFKRGELLIGKAVLHNTATPSLPPHAPFFAHVSECDWLEFTLNKGTEDPQNDRSWNRKKREREHA